MARGISMPHSTCRTTCRCVQLGDVAAVLIGSIMAFRVGFAFYVLTNPSGEAHWHPASMASLLPLSTRCHRAPSSGSKLGFVERFDEGYFRTDLIKCPLAPKSQ